MRDLMEYMHECMAELDGIGIEYGNIVEVKVNTRARRWGQCRVVPGGYSININQVLLDERNDENGLKNTIIHELLHSCKGGHGHKGEWKRLANKVHRELGYNITRTSSADDKGVEAETRPVRVKYTITCEKCGRSWTRERACNLTKYTNNYRCTCGGNLQCNG